MASAPNSLATATETAPRIGCPSIYTDEMARAICDLVACGENLHRISERDEFPSRETIYRWLREKPAFYDNYTRARALRSDARSERIDDIRDRVLSGEIDPNAARVAIDAEKWQAGKENPKRYGDQVQHNVEVNQLVIALPRPADVQRRIEAGRAAEEVVEAEVVESSPTTSIGAVSETTE